HQEPDAIGLRPEFSTAEAVDIDFLSGRLITANEMSGQTDAGQRQMQTAAHKQVNGAEADRVAAALIDDVVQIAIPRVVSIPITPMEIKLLEQIVVDALQDLFRARGKVQPLAQLARPMIIQGLIRMGVDVGILSARQ